MADQQPTFQQAMEITAAWLQQWDNEEISDEVLANPLLGSSIWLLLTPRSAITKETFSFGTKSEKFEAFISILFLNTSSFFDADFLANGS